jgi:hypothetical protein
LILKQRNNRNRWSAIILLLALSLIAWGLTACDEEEESKPVPADVRNLLEENLRAMEVEDLERLKQTLHPDTVFYYSTVNMSRELFDTYDLDYEIEKAELLSESGDEMRVRVVQVTRKISGPEFRDNRITVVHTLRRANGEWKLYATEVAKITYLD